MIGKFDWPDGYVPPELPALTPEQASVCVIGESLSAGECFVQACDDSAPADRSEEGVPLWRGNEFNLVAELPNQNDCSSESCG